MKNNEFDFGLGGSSEEDILYGAFEGALFEDNELMTESPAMYQVMLLNDDETHADFARYVLLEIFHHTVEGADIILQKMQAEGLVICGLYTKDAAETKILLVNNYASRNQHPLKCVMQRETEHAIKKS